MSQSVPLTGRPAVTSCFGFTGPGFKHMVMFWVWLLFHSLPGNKQTTAGREQSRSVYERTVRVRVWLMPSKAAIVRLRNLSWRTCLKERVRPFERRMMDWQEDTHHGFGGADVGSHLQMKPHRRLRGFYSIVPEPILLNYVWTERFRDFTEEKVLSKDFNKNRKNNLKRIV